MKNQMRFLQGWKLAALVAVALSMGACAKNNVGADGAMASAGNPGEPAGFVVQCGDRVVLRERPDRAEPQAIAKLEKQAQWLQTYNRYSFTIEGMPTSAAPANTTSRSAHAAPSRCAAIPRLFFSPRHPMRTACAPSPTARSVPVAV